MKIIDYFDSLLNGKYRKLIVVLLVIVSTLAVGDFINKYFVKDYNIHFANGKYSLPYDLLPYYNAGYILRKGQGEQLYNYQKQKESFLELHEKYIKGFPPPGTGYFYNPPNSLLFVYLYSFFSPKVSWFLIKLSLLLVFILSAFTALRRLQHKDACLLGLIFVCAVLYFPPFFINIRNGQFSLLVACSFYFYWYFSQKDKNALAGMCLALTLIKPQMGIPLLLIPLFFKQYQILLYTALFTSLLTLFAFVFIGLTGFHTYFLSALELAGMQNTAHNVPIPGGPECLGGQLEAWKISPKISKLAGIFMSLFSGAMMIFILFKKSTENVFLPTAFKVFLVGLFSLFIGSYHTDNDYCLIIALILILIQSNYKYYKQAIIYFGFFSFFAGYLLDRFNIHLPHEIIRLREHTYFKTYFLFSFCVALFLLIKLLCGEVFPKNTRKALSCYKE